MNDKKKHAEYMTQYYRSNPEKKAAHTKWVIDRARKRKLLLIALKGGCCIDCGYDGHPAVFHFHHRDAEQKEKPIAELLINGTDEKLRIEAEKCDLLCANCHSIRHWSKPRSGYREPQ